jgi:NAD(P)-dependent dehydrogenase (short-subunit alcohol dehydrogenase family)/catechol 2,3-dioxygenase-like lactoylglutathione lyase family enzyme
VLYGLVNNAGIVDPGDFVFFRDCETYRHVMEVNFFGQLKVTQALLPLMLGTAQTLSSGPRILNLSSVCGTSSGPGNGAYSASKFAVEAWSDSLRLEVKPFGIHVVKIRPGAISTQIQNDWGSHYLQNFDAAPDAIRQLYGADDFRARAANFTKSNGTKQMTPPSLVVASLVDILALQTQNAALEPYYWIGSDAHTIWRALHTLPTSVVDTVKAAMQFDPVQPTLPPVGIISHLTIRVRNIQASLPFYTAFGFEALGTTENGLQFLNSGASKVKRHWSTLLLLYEDPTMKPRGAVSDAGMTRLAILTTNMKRDMKKLADQGFQPMAPPATQSGTTAVAYCDPDNFVVYFDEFRGLGGAFVGASLWWKGKKDPAMFHWTMNCVKVKTAMTIFETLGFETYADMRTDQVYYNMLPAFCMDPKATVIEHIRMCKDANDSVWTTLMEWSAPTRSACNGVDELTNTMTIAVSDVHAALKKAREAGMTVPNDGSISYRKLPVFGEVLVGTAYVEDLCNRVEFCCFADRRV